MEQYVYKDPAHNLDCQRRFTCKAVKCPDSYDILRDQDCHVDKFSRYQPPGDIWYKKDWEDVNRITWREVFGLKEAWLYAIYIIIIAVFVFMALLFVKVLFIYRYY
ncbi:MAG: hypothetical protein KKG76_06390 [Euryarchaeota archaeon]|nr:hypothetical protein [Euryarchaeota archaeon]